MFTSELSNLSHGVNNAFIIILSIIFFFLIGLTAVMIYFIFKYRESKNPVATQIHGNTQLEILWTVIPLLIVIAMFWFGWTGWRVMETKPPKDAIHIETIGRMWKWSFKYTNGQFLDTLIIPAGKAVALDLNSMDVIHSFYIPAFRLKKDMVPGTPRVAWFIANTPGTYDIFCTEYCGLDHSGMITAVKVLPVAEYEAWYNQSSSATESAVAAVKTVSPAQLGKKVMERMGCVACHSADGTKIVGPSYLGIYGEEVEVETNGNSRRIKVDEEYIKRSVLDPNADIVKGYKKGLMLSYKDQLSAQEIDQIIEYIKSLK